MGAWGIGNWQNDSALDWAADLDGWEHVAEALQLVGEGELSTPQCCQALAAAEVVADGREMPLRRAAARQWSAAPDGVLEWLQSNTAPTFDLIDQGARVCDEIQQASELQALFEEAGQLDDWRRVVSSLRDRLAPRPTAVGVVAGSGVRVDHHDEISLSLEPPSFGWLPIRLRVGGFSLDGLVSGVLNDPLGELIGVVEFLQRRRIRSVHRVCFWLEPSGYTLDFGIGEDNRLTVLVSYDPLFVPPMTRREMVEIHEAVVELDAAQDLLHSALTACVATTSEQALDEWCGGQTYFNRLSEVVLGAGQGE